MTRSPHSVEDKLSCDDDGTTAAAEGCAVSANTKAVKMRLKRRPMKRKPDQTWSRRGRGIFSAVRWAKEPSETQGRFAG
jgi:hypothetical protein